MSEKTKAEFTVGQKVWRIEIRNKVKDTFEKNGVFISEHKIIGISRYSICVDTEFFATFSILKKGERKESYSSYLNEIECSIRTNNNILGDGIKIDLYTTSKPTKATLDKMAAFCAVKIDKEFGWLFNGAKEKIYEMIDEFNQLSNEH